jgi:hypothetical protein
MSVRAPHRSKLGADGPDRSSWAGSKKGSQRRSAAARNRTPLTAPMTTANRVEIPAILRSVLSEERGVSTFLASSRQDRVAPPRRQ